MTGQIHARIAYPHAIGAEVILGFVNFPYVISGQATFAVFVSVAFSGRDIVQPRTLSRTSKIKLLLIYRNPALLLSVPFLFVGIVFIIPVDLSAFLDFGSCIARCPNLYVPDTRRFLVSRTPLASK